MIFLALYDSRGQCQYVASTNDPSQAQQYLSAGFIEVTEAEYQRCSELVNGLGLSELPRLQRAQQVLQGVAVAPDRVVATQVNEDRLRRIQQAQSNKLSSAATDWLAREISKDRWFRLMANGVGSGLLAATALAKGGLQYLTQADKQQIEQAYEVELSYLIGFRRDIDSLTPKQVINRASSYANATTARYWTAHTRALGLPVLPAMPGVRTSCGSNCKCNWNIIPLPGVGNWDLQWRISAIESCEECLRRQDIFNPLKIRNGVVQPFNPNGIYK